MARLHAHNAAQLIYISSLFFSLCICQDSPTFCNRLYHSIVIADNKLFVDGGELRTVTKDNNVTASIPDSVNWLDLSKPFNNTNATTWGHIPKNGSSPSSNAPTLNDGSMWATNNSLYLFGGAISLVPGAPSVPPQNGIWQYNMGTEHWGLAVTGGQQVQRTHWGQSAQAVSNSVAYFLGGAITPKSDPTFNGASHASPYLTQGLITFDERSGGLLNTSTTGLNQDGTSLGAFMTLIEFLGSGGVIVAFGGVMNDPGAPTGLSDEDLSDPSMHRLLSNVSVYDISTQQWYEQAATGDVPPWRYVGCSVVVSAPDKSSHSIYVFGGWGQSSGDSDGHVYVLSIPSFRWIRVNQDSALRARHQCNLIGGHTMLVVGGVKPMDTILQPLDTTTKGCDTSAMFSQGLGMFNMNNHSWVTSWNPAEGAATYEVHPTISQVIGGNQKGGATLQAPLNGFMHPELGTLLGIHQSNVAAPSTTAPLRRKRVDGAMIAGTIVAAISLVSFVSLTIFFLMRRRRRRNHIRNQEISPPITKTRRAAEIGLTREPSELSGSTMRTFELDNTEKPLPTVPFGKKPPIEMEGESRLHQALGELSELEKKSQIDMHRYR